MKINKLYCENCLRTMKRMPDNFLGSIVTDPPYGLQFMNKGWDYQVPSVKIWKEIHRVLKPGGHVLCFSGTRTYHRVVCNIEDAGFEIRDQIQWIYGSGFPKSMDIAKAIDKMYGAKRKVISKGKNFGNTKNKPAYGDYAGEWDVSEPQTKQAKKWQGWGTALKPANEPICLARKGYINDVAAWMQIYGTGGINIDACRIKGEVIKYKNGCGGGKNKINRMMGGNKKNDEEFRQRKWINKKGRWPANVIHDGSEEVLKLFPHSKSNDHIIHNKGKKDNTIYGNYNAIDSFCYSDEGSAARFFYCAKASKSERNAGLESLKAKRTTDGCIRANLESARKYQANSALRQNIHPTVKPIKLMEYLVKLITPKKEICYDPFAGSGSTLIACKNLDIQYIGSELNLEYVRIANKRLK